jgi:hypothetical protein
MKWKYNVEKVVSRKYNMVSVWWILFIALLMFIIFHWIHILTSNEYIYMREGFNVVGAEDAGKMTSGTTPNYSSLTSGYGTKERIITNDIHAPPAKANLGDQFFRKIFDHRMQLFNKRYRIEYLPDMPKYERRKTLTGIFIEDGPYPANYEF